MRLQNTLMPGMKANTSYGKSMGTHKMALRAPSCG